MIIAVPTPMGNVHAEVDAAHILRLWLPGEGAPREVAETAVPAAALPPDPAWLHDLAADLRAYGEGRPVDLGRWVDRLDLSGLTPFRRRVYMILARLGRGRTCTYGELAAWAGSPGAARAVGSAMAENPFPLIVPCHRVVAADGLGGFGGGLALKKRLLALEGAADG